MKLIPRRVVSKQEIHVRSTRDDVPGIHRYCRTSYWEWLGRTFRIRTTQGDLPDYFPFSLPIAGISRPDDYRL